MLTLTGPTPIALSEADARLAESSMRSLAHLLALLRDAAPEVKPLEEASLRLSVERSGGERTELSVPSAALPLLIALLTELSQGKEVAVVTTDTEVTTQQAADFMHVSRPYVVKLVDAGKIPSRKVGVRRRVRLGDVLRYMEETGDAASRALDEMVAENQRLGLYP
jgi:excisionase family DNA binding protein